MGHYGKTESSTPYYGRQIDGRFILTAISVNDVSTSKCALAYLIVAIESLSKVILTGANLSSDSKVFGLSKQAPHEMRISREDGVFESIGFEHAHSSDELYIVRNSLRAYLPSFGTMSISTPQVAVMTALMFAWSASRLIVFPTDAEDTGEDAFVALRVSSTFNFLLTDIVFLGQMIDMDARFQFFGMWQKMMPW